MTETDGYDIRPDGVASVLDAVDGASELLSKTFDEMSDSVSEASGAAGSSGIVTGALAEVLTWLGERQALMDSAVERATNGVAEAVDAYARGDAAMARTITDRMMVVLDGGG